MVLMALVCARRIVISDALRMIHSRTNESAYHPVDLDAYVPTTKAGFTVGSEHAVTLTPPLPANQSAAVIGAQSSFCTPECQTKIKAQWHVSCFELRDMHNRGFDFIETGSTDDVLSLCREGLDQCMVCMSSCPSCMR
eukprot:TRINITY_DN74355_c0_g1_i1.p1 TRINITY_DN74355_c0_g1~~TRINITY_DN74355_c0_g1_i1.p1  ORF type:complete len:160 (+),score=18.21 TRINITY_DN74355_c0_g1_i1:68-481(+)